MNTQTAVSPVRRTAVSGLAIIGFVALVVAGLWLAIYSTRYVPSVVNRLSLAAVYIGSVFTPAPSTLSVVPTPTASTTISFGTAPATSTPVTTSKPKPVTPTAGTATSKTYTVGGTVATDPSGLADLDVNINSTGYMTTSSTSSYVASSSVPHGDNAAVRFTIKNVGTNYSGTWTFSATIPTYPAYTFTSQPQQSLAPGDSIDYTLGFNQAISGQNKIVTVSVSPAVPDSNKNNNTASATLTVLP